MELHIRSLGQEDPWRKAWQPTPVFLPGKSHAQRSLEGYSPWGHKELDTNERLSMHCHYLYLQFGQRHKMQNARSGRHFSNHVFGCFPLFNVCVPWLMCASQPADTHMI